PGFDECDGLRAGDGAVQHNSEAQSEAQAHGATANLLRLGFLCEHRDDPLPCVSSVQVPRPRCASSPAALLPPRANSNRMLCPDPPPGPAASATLSSDRHCRGDSVEVQAGNTSWWGLLRFYRSFL